MIISILLNLVVKVVVFGGEAGPSSIIAPMVSKLGVNPK